MHMSFKNSYIGLAAGVVVLVVGLIVTGSDRSYATTQWVGVCSFAIGIAVLMLLEARDHRPEAGWRDD